VLRYVNRCLVLPPDLFPQRIDRHQRTLFIRVEPVFPTVARGEIALFTLRHAYSVKKEIVILRVLVYKAIN